MSAYLYIMAKGIRWEVGCGLATESSCRQRDWRRKHLEHLKERERRGKRERESTNSRMSWYIRKIFHHVTVLNPSSGTEIITSWGIRARSLLLNRCPVCLEAERLGLYVCGQRASSMQGEHPVITELGGLAAVPSMSLHTGWEMLYKFNEIEGDAYICINIF